MLSGLRMVDPADLERAIDQVLDPRDGMLSWRLLAAVGSLSSDFLMARRIPRVLFSGLRMFDRADPRSGMLSVCC